MSVLNADGIWNRIINIKYDVPNNKLEMFDNYKQDIDRFYSSISEKHA